MLCPASCSPRHERVAKTEPSRLGQALAHAAGPTYLAPQSNLADGHHVRGHGYSGKRRCQRQANRQVRSRFASASAASHRNINVALGHRDTRSPVEDGDKEAHPTWVEAGDKAPRDS